MSQRNRQQRIHIAAPIGGINTVAAGVDMPPGDSVHSYNLIGGEWGLRSRLGWREWVTGLDGQVRSLFPFAGSTKDGSLNRLFAATETGIWDVSASTITPTKVVAFATSGPDAGWGNSCVFVNAAGGHFLPTWDEENGYRVYSESGASWAEGGLSGTPVTGVDPGDLVFGLPWKNRLWMVKRDSGEGYYLDIGAVTGAAAKFNFGARFQHGGDLRCLASLTFDGGGGSDDYLVAISGGGDVLIYRGTDPSLFGAFELVGVWYVGAVPAGRRLTTDSGGDLLLMTSTGIHSVKQMLTGGATYTGQYETAKISNLWNQLQASTSNLRGWAMRIHPQDSCLMCLVPVATGQPTQQLVMSLSTKGWHRYRDLPIGVCAEPWGGTLYAGTEDGKVIVNDGYVDGVLLSDPNSYSAIDVSLLTAFGNGGTSEIKRVQDIVTQILSQGGAVVHRAEARYDWDLSEVAPVTAPAAAGASSWDVGLWDVAKWGGEYQPQRSVFGAFGMGSAVAVGIRGRASSRMTLTGIDVSFDTGGML